MALKRLLFPLLWVLAVFHRSAVARPNVTCSTDLRTSLNCSWAGAVQTQPVFLHASCRDEDLEVNGSCEVQPPRSWCVISPESFYLVLSVDTECAAQAADGDGVMLSGGEPTPWVLGDVVKPEPPCEVQVTPVKDFYRITWDHLNLQDCLTYTVRVRNASQLSKEPVYSLSSDVKRLRVDQKRLQPGAHYLVDVRAIMCPDNLYEGPWSEWSPAVEFRSTDTNDSLPFSLGPATVAWHLFYIPSSVLISVIAVIAAVGFVYLIKKHLFPKIPKPDHFFVPLYSGYGGNFKEWVKPAFSERDYVIISSQAQMKWEHAVIQRDGEKRGPAEAAEAKPGELRVHEGPAPPLWDGGPREGDPVGHISIHTVTLSEEEEPEARDSARGSFELDGAAAEPRAGSEEAGGGLQPPLRRQASRRSSVEGDGGPLHVQLLEAERASLDSLVLNEQSEDGYPHVDLDTIDSGFGEYNSPAAAQGAGPANLFHEHMNIPSNYVKQWMVCRTIEEG